MKRYRLLNIRKWYVPDFVIFFKGKVDRLQLTGQIF